MGVYGCGLGRMGSNKKNTPMGAGLAQFRSDDSAYEWPMALAIAAPVLIVKPRPSLF